MWEKVIVIFIQEHVTKYVDNTLVHTDMHLNIYF